MKVNPLNIVIAILLWGVFVASALAIYAWQWLHLERQTFTEGEVYRVEKGASLHAVAQDFHREGYIHWPTLWVAYAKFANLTHIKSGEFRFESYHSPKSILEKLNQGRVVQYQVTFIEGHRFRDILARLHGKKNITKTFEYVDALKTLNDAGVQIEHEEGWFFPDTYQYSAGDTDLSLLLRAHKKMVNALALEWSEREEGLPYETPYEALIMASIIEKETGVAHEREEIAGVFVRRLKTNMRLQTDPTVIYGMGEGYTGNITRADLRAPTPYNTYVIKGLPPSPIALPGREAIRAALNPAEGEALYFVAKGDGSHYFSSSLDEHNRAVNKFQKKRRSDYRSSPKVMQSSSGDNE